MTSLSELGAQIANAPKLHDVGNPLWLGPCADGWNGGITQSMIGRFLSCRERFRLKYILGLEPPDRWNHKLGYGNIWHVCEKALASEITHFGEIVGTTLRDDNMTDHIKEMCGQYPLQRDDILKWANVCRVQFPEYVKYWSEHPDVVNRTPLLQEEVFDVPYRLPSGRTVRLRGRWDSVDVIPRHVDQDGREWPTGIWLQENKTKGTVNQQQIKRQLSFDLQTMVYLIALREEVLRRQNQQHSSAKWYHNILGVRYNVVRRPLSGGKGNISPHKAKSTKTKYTPAETPEEFYERLRRDYIAAEPNDWFFRIRAEITPHDMEVFRKTCLDPLLETICWWYESVTKTSYALPSHHLVERAMNYRTPFGVYNALEDDGATEYDAYLATGAEIGLRRTTTLFPELK